MLDLTEDHYAKLQILRLLLKLQITRPQVEQFLNIVRGLTLTSSDESTLELVLAHNAQKAREAALCCFGVDLPTDASGVKVLDDLLNAMHAAMRPTRSSQRGRGVSLNDAAAVSASLGAHLCELVQLDTPGNWGYTEFEGERQVVLVLSPGNFMAVPQKAGKQFANGRTDSVGFFFGLAALFAKGIARAADMSPEERKALKDKVARIKAAGKARKALPPEERKKWARAVAKEMAKRARAHRAEREKAEKEEAERRKG